MADDRPRGGGETRIHEWFARQAAHRGDAVAVLGGGDSLSYRELNRRANRLAHHLRAIGVDRGHVVGVCLPRTPTLVTALLAVLKAGAAYVPLDTANPHDRLSFMLADAGARVLITDDTASDWPVEHVVDPGSAEFDTLPDTAPAVEVTGADLAYVIYTSGSTGTPKGVLVEHRNLTALLHGTAGLFSFDEQDVWSLFSSAAFDVSVWEMWGALLHGGRLVVVSEQMRRNPEELYALLATEGVTVLNQTPAAFCQLIRVEEEGEPRQLALRVVIFAGEALTPEMLRPWIKRHGDEKPVLVNMYGITETTVHSTYRRMTAADVDDGRGSVIGGPIPSWTMHVLDEQRAEVPVGEPGELYVGGAGVARGYLDRPELTAERFVDDPFSARPGARLYRSGDQARRLPDGDVEYLGRLDHQVKIRGYRIELGEIENALVKHDAISEAVVVVDSDDAGDPRLVGYWVGTGVAAPTAALLREHLAARLPDYMVPNVFVALDALPLTVNGKVDRRALPAPEAARPEPDASSASADDVEQAVTEIWAKALWTDTIGPDDDFFDFGGHSMLATQVVVAVKERLGVKVTLRMLFDNPTIREFAAAVRTLRSAG